jgi:hypothetical protein
MAPLTATTASSSAQILYESPQTLCEASIVVVGLYV